MQSEQKQKLQEIFEDLMSRFIINVPESEISSIERICFQIEQAHWFYEDFVRDSDPSLPHYKLKYFAGEMFQRCPLLKEFVKETNIEEIYKRFVAYKMNVPVCGAIILNEANDKVLMVRGWGNKASWTFPKGKINQNESDASCAIREVLEETGFDISSLIDPDAYLEAVLRGEQRNRFFIIRNVSEATEFCPKTRKEIGDIKWHWLKDLPGFKGGAKNFSTRYYSIQKFTGKLKDWIQKNTSKKSQSKSIKTNSLKQVESLKSMLGITPPSIPSISPSNNQSNQYASHVSTAPSVIPIFGFNVPQSVPDIQNQSNTSSQPEQKMSDKKQSLLSILRGDSQVVIENESKKQVISPIGTRPDSLRIKEVELVQTPEKKQDEQAIKQSNETSAQKSAKKKKTKKDKVPVVTAILQREQKESQPPVSKIEDGLINIKSNSVINLTPKKSDRSKSQEKEESNIALKHFNKHVKLDEIIASTQHYFTKQQISLQIYINNFI